MNGVNFLAAIVAAFAAFVISGLWYSPLLFGKQWLLLRGIAPDAVPKMQPREVIGEIVRTIIIAGVLAHFVVVTGIAGFFGALGLALWIWVGFYAMIIAGSVIHDKVPWKLAAIHAGDGLVRIMLMTIIISIWR
jgi:Protein of unknown function (DUF1761)